MTVRAEPVRKTRFAANQFTLAALGFGTFGAERPIADLAVAATLGANDLAAVGADPRAIVADRIIAVATVVDALVIHDVATVVAGDAVPIGQADVGAVRVVGRENATHHDEEIAQPAFFQRRSNGGRPIAFTEHFIADMRVRNGLILGRGMRFDGDYKVRDLVAHLL